MSEKYTVAQLLKNYKDGDVARLNPEQYRDLIEDLTQEPETYKGKLSKIEEINIECKEQEK